MQLCILYLDLPTLKGEHLEKQTDAVAGDACWEAYQGQVLALSFWEIDSTGLTTIVSHSCPRLKPGKRGGSKVHSYQIDTEKMRNNFQFSQCSESQCVICQEKRSSVATSTASSRKEGPKSYQKRKDFRLDSGSFCQGMGLRFVLLQDGHRPHVSHQDLRSSVSRGSSKASQTQSWTSVWSSRYIRGWSEWNLSTANKVGGWTE